jgi:hypothetical protein
MKIGVFNEVNEENSENKLHFNISNILLYFSIAMEGGLKYNLDCCVVIDDYKKEKSHQGKENNRKYIVLFRIL